MLCTVDNFSGSCRLVTWFACSRNDAIASANPNREDGQFAAVSCIVVSASKAGNCSQAFERVLGLPPVGLHLDAESVRLSNNTISFGLAG